MVEEDTSETIKSLKKNVHIFHTKPLLHLLNEGVNDT